MRNQGDSYTERELGPLAPLEAAIIMRLRRMRREQFWGKFALTVRNGVVVMAASDRTENPDDLLAELDVLQRRESSAQQSPEKDAQ